MWLITVCCNLPDSEGTSLLASQRGEGERGKDRGRGGGGGGQNEFGEQK